VPRPPAGFFAGSLPSLADSVVRKNKDAAHGRGTHTVSSWRWVRRMQEDAVVARLSPRHVTSTGAV